MCTLLLLIVTVAAAPSREAWKSDLLSKEVARAALAAQKLGAARRADILVDALALGAPPEVAGAILDALAASGSRQADETFLRYADHRNPDLRRKALLGLGASPGRRAAVRLL